MQPLRVGLTFFGLNLATLAFLTCAGVGDAFNSAGLIAACRRDIEMAALRLLTGLCVSGFCTRPASIAACASVELVGVAGEVVPGRSLHPVRALAVIGSNTLCSVYFFVQFICSLSWKPYGRLTEPMVYDAATDHYVPISWDDAFELAGGVLRGLDSPNEAAFYTSGRLSNEASFLYQWFVREYGTNNLPDCSNMCHEASGVALKAAIGTNKGTVDLQDWEQADAIFLMGVNAASNSPRMLTYLAAAHDRGAQIVHINPLIEAAATRTIVPHHPRGMATFHATSTEHVERPAPHRRGCRPHPGNRQSVVRTGRNRCGGD